MSSEAQPELRTESLNLLRFLKILPSPGQGRRHNSTSEPLEKTRHRPEGLVLACQDYQKVTVENHLGHW